MTVGAAVYHSNRPCPLAGVTHVFTYPGLLPGPLSYRLRLAPEVAAYFRSR